MTDTDRIGKYLRDHGSITSYEIRIKGLSGNPSQRITELVDRGYEIEPVRFQRDGRPCVNYILKGAPSSSSVGAVRPGIEDSGASLNATQQVTDSGEGDSTFSPDLLPVSQATGYPTSQQRGGLTAVQDRVNVSDFQRASGAGVDSVPTDDGREVEARPELCLFTMPARYEDAA